MEVDFQRFFCGYVEHFVESCFLFWNSVNSCDVVVVECRDFNFRFEFSHGFEKIAQDVWYGFLIGRHWSFEDGGMMEAVDVGMGNAFGIGQSGRSLEGVHG